jgi:hypothetical protein
MAATAIFQLRDALFLGSMDGQEAVEDLPVVWAWKLLFDQPHQGPDSRFMRIAGGEPLAAQALAEAAAEVEFVRSGRA